MTSGCTQATTNANNFNNSYDCAADVGAGNAQITAWSTGRNNEDGGNATYTLSGSGWASAFVTNNGGSGFGAVSRSEANVAGSLNVGSPNHAVDNQPNAGRFDFIMVKFDSAQVLTNVGIGWAGVDSDMTIMRWTGNAAPVTTATTATGGGGTQNITSTTIGAGGWELVGNYSDVCRDSGGNFLTGTSNTCASTSQLIGSTTYTTSQVRYTNASSQLVDGTGSTLASSYWLIAAYNTTMGGGTWTNSNDAFKLDYLKTASYSCPLGQNLSVGGNCLPGGNNSGVPEPGTLALAGLAILGGWRLRRRQDAVQQD